MRFRALRLHYPRNAAALLAAPFFSLRPEAHFRFKAQHLRAVFAHLAIHGDVAGNNLLNALDEGFDVPEAEVALIVSSSATKRQRIQRLGRVLRSTVKKDRATVITLYATKHEQERLMRDPATHVASGISWKEISQ